MLTEAQVIAEAGALFSWETIDVDDNLREDEALIEMKASGVCHTDL
jgi:aryl-alcohol dehydrogenase